MYEFFCNKRYDISFSDFHKMIKLVLPSNYTSRETRGFYRKDYVPCNIIAIRQLNDDTMKEQNIYCWLGAKGLTILADTELTAQISFEVLKNVKQNPEEYKTNDFNFSTFNTNEFIELIKPDLQYSTYEQKNYYEGFQKFLVKETNGDEVEIIIDNKRHKISLSGSYTSLYTFILMIIEKILRSTQEVSD